MTHDEFTQTIIRSVIAIVRAMVIYYDIPVSRFIPKMGADYERMPTTTSTLDVTESKPL